MLAGYAHTSGKVLKETTSPVLGRILEKGELVVGTSASIPPLNMTTKDGEIIGLEPDLAKVMANAMGVKLRIEAMPFSELLPALESGKIDMILSGMTMTPNRNLKVAFVGPYYVTGKAFLTKMETIASMKEASEINSPDFTLAALNGSTSQFFIEAVLPKVKLVTTKDHDEAVDKVIKGEVHALVADLHICLVSVTRYPDKGLLTLVTPLTYEPLGVAVPANDPHLINWLENFLNTIEASGQFTKMKKQWFNTREWLKRLP